MPSNVRASDDGSGTGADHARSMPVDNHGGNAGHDDACPFSGPILDDLAPTEQPVDISDEWTDDDLADAASASVRQADQSIKGNRAHDESR